MTFSWQNAKPSKQTHVCDPKRRDRERWREKGERARSVKVTERRKGKGREMMKRKGLSNPLLSGCVL